MDLSTLHLFEIAKAIARVLPAAAAFFAIYKHMSDLGLIRTPQRKQLPEQIDELTNPKEGLEKVHPLVIQVKFHTAFGGARACIPHGNEILALLENSDLAEYSNLLEYAACAKFVAYSPSERTFSPRGDWTDAKLHAQGLRDFFYYLFTATPAFALLVVPPFSIKALIIRIPLAFLFGLFAVANAMQAKKIGRAEKLLQRTRALATSKSETPEKAANGTDHPAHPSRIAPEKAPGTLPERGVSVKRQDPSKH